jgi:hypothetical protein
MQPFTVASDRTTTPQGYGTARFGVTDETGSQLTVTLCGEDHQDTAGNIPPIPFIDYIVLSSQYQDPANNYRPASANLILEQIFILDQINIIIPDRYH